MDVGEAEAGGIKFNEDIVGTWGVVLVELQA